ncbi:MAG: Endonuclease/exonuclease/phosphatase [Labilithrix sp.]|nr:Endonuclease/exonuclease/phosphatase [Labilithrix sp.]
MRNRLGWLVMLGATMGTACSADAPPDDGENVGSAGAAIRNCPVTDPDYPLCEPAPPPTVCNGGTGWVQVSAPTITLGQSLTVSWSGQLPKACNESLTLNGVPVPASGSKTVVPRSSVDASFVLGVTSHVIARASAALVLPSTVHVDGNTEDWKRLLLQALDTTNTKVVLGQNVDMDLSGRDLIPVAPGVTLTSEIPLVVGPVATQPASVVRGGVFSLVRPGRDAKNLGPRLYTTQRPKALFSLRCLAGSPGPEHITFSNFRIQGPDFDTMDGDDKLERGIEINSCLGVEIANMEMSGWSGAAIHVSDASDRILGYSSVSIHDSFFHHNQHEGGNGYGIDMGEGAYSNIERNVFDFNRHAITASGKAGTGYRADHNLILKGGGRHSKWYNEYTHLMDVHGDANCPDVPLNQHTWNCGNAGDQFWMTNNAFQYTNDNDIKIRGTPRIAALINGNVFARHDKDDAIDRTEGDTHINIGANTYDVDTYGEYGVCDFDGDGKDDLFLATGASWWFKSAAKLHWVYLSPATERLSQVRLGDFDGDHRCDVMAINRGTNAWEIASGGSGAWTALPGSYPGVAIDELRTGDFDGDGITDLFRRDPSGQWWAISPGHYGPLALQSSDQPLDSLKLGDFDGNGITDVLGHSGGKWAISWNGTSPWQPASGLSDDLGRVFVANVDGQPGDDVVRYVQDTGTKAHWERSSGARTPWVTFRSFAWPASSDPAFVPAALTKTFVGRFGAGSAAGVLMVEPDRMSSFAGLTDAAFVPHALYAY